MFVIRREPHNPILAPQRDRPWEAVATYNPSAVSTKDGVRLFYRALGSPDALQTPTAGLSSIGTAFAEDGVHFQSRQQVIIPQEPWDVFGCEDPRVTFFEGRWYCFYTALGGYPFGPDNIRVALAVGDTPDHFTERHLITPFNAKAATLFPERVGGDVVMLLTAHTDWTSEHPRPTIALARAKRIEDFFSPDYWRDWHERLSDHALPELRRVDADHIEVGASPFKTQAGWLLIYSYIQDYYKEHERIFSIEAALLDLHDPQKLISRTESILVPQEFYENYGLVPNVVFPTSATLGDNGRLDIWYGAADTVCAKASVRLNDLMRALDPQAPARTFARAEKNPILAPRDGFESRNVLNPAAIDINGSVYILYRAMDAANTSTIGLAVSHDGLAIDERLSAPIYVPRADFEMKRGGGNSGCEDPRIVRIGDTLHMTYTAYDGVHVPAGALSSISVEDFLARRYELWSAPFVLTPEGVDDKDLALLPEKIGGNYLLYHRINNQICADVLPDLTTGKRVSRCIEIMGPRHGMWDGAKVGVAGPPIRVGENWLMIYHGVSRHATYRLGAALLGPDGTTLLARTADPIFEPMEKYEKEGEVPNVVFSCGAIVRGDLLILYYGAADRVIGVATASLSHIIDALS
ncbi:MAG: Glycosidase-related protein [Parcubacteria group bacterium GW2011_GWB1_57_6]|nr:MAG: Glycosidase-related protein [Parcubacteria group bacterium GW2011_GWA1_56_13]KKW46766.1 MAG: Glycosidase-related protein [Parcubacteria group bacterium GW2011_GWB1_57_6]